MAARLDVEALSRSPDGAAYMTASTDLRNSVRALLKHNARMTPEKCK